MATSSALLWLTHVWTPELQAEFETLHGMRGVGLPEVWLLLDARTPGAADLARRYRCHVFDEAALFARPYPRLPGRGLMHHHHFPLLDFFLSHPAFDTYWVVEYDVRYTGSWASLLTEFQAFPDDLVTSHIRRFDQEPAWDWWWSLAHPSASIPRDRYLRSFNVIYRISRRALAFLHEAQLGGWRGYSEVLFPTLLRENGFTLLDFGGDGEFTPPGYRNRFYTSDRLTGGTLLVTGTLRYQPARTRPGWRPNTLYHPVKPRAMREPIAIRARIVEHWARALARRVLGRGRSDAPGPPSL